MAIDRDQLLLEMHADLRALTSAVTAYSTELKEIKSTVKVLDRRVTWAQGVAAAIFSIITLGVAAGKAFFKVD